MYDYFFLTSNGYIDRFGCREALIYAYANRFNMTNDDTHFYFGHVLGATAKIDKVKEVYKNLCDTIWKGNIEYKIVQLKELKKDCSQEIDKYKKEYPNTVVIKIDRNVNPRDISLILYLSWFGLIPDIDSSTRKYYIAKKYTDKIPNTYSDTNTVFNNLTGGNGPNLYMSRLYNQNFNLYNELDSLYLEHTDEFDWDNAVNSTDIFGIPSTTDEYYDDDEDDNDEDDEDDDDEEENN